MPVKPITVYDVAREAGVSPATVSRVITGNTKVSADKEARVREVMQNLDFRPNAFARSLLKRESRMIGMILPDISNPFFSQIFLAAEQFALTKGYTLVLCNTMNNASTSVSELESQYLDILLERRVDGIIFLGGRVNEIVSDPQKAAELARINDLIPVVIINGRMKGVASHQVLSDERTGMFELVDHLFGLGHRRFAFIGGVPGITSFELKIRALRDALKSKGLAIEEQHIVVSDYSIESGEDAFETLNGRGKPMPTAVLAVNDSVAIGAVRKAVSLGYTVPKDLSIAGFDDSYLSRYYLPAITTVSQNYEELSKATIEVLTGLILGKKLRKETIVPVDLVVRESTAPVPAAAPLARS